MHRSDTVRCDVHSADREPFLVVFVDVLVYSAPVQYTDVGTGDFEEGNLRCLVRNEDAAGSQAVIVCGTCRRQLAFA